jgi:two-component system LytT family response regulator
VKIRALIADDEESARSRLRKLLAAFPIISIAAETCDGIETLDAILRVRPDVVFLDVQMPGLSGLEVVSSLTSETLPLIVFATAYDEYAIAAFEANAVGYLLKPINRDRLASAIDRIERLLRTPSDIREEQSRLAEVAAANRTQLSHIVAIQRDRYLLLPLTEVCFFKVEDGVTKVKADATTYRTNYQIGLLEQRLPNPPFIRAHRSIIVNLDKVAEISPLFKGTYLLTMKDAQGSEIRVSERQSKLVRHLLEL